MNKLFLDKKDNKYFYVGDPVCNLKGCSLGVNAFHVIMHPKHSKSFESVYCHNCMTQLKSTGLMIGSEIKKVLLCDSVPIGAIPIPIKRISLGGNPSTNVFNVATSNRGVAASSSNVVVKDKTRLSGRESLDDVQIGLSPDLVDEKNNVLDDDELDSFLLDVSNSKPVLPESKKKLLGDDS